MIIDCFPFFDELDVLEIRLRELSPVVDRFVLSEATLTFSGQPKPLYFAENRGRFAPFLDRIEHIVVDDYQRMNIRDTWSMDWGQKQMAVEIMQKRIQIRDDDFVLLSDCDEIPRATAVYGAAKNVRCRIATPLMPIFYYWLNCQQVGPFERCAKWVRGDILQDHTIRSLREDKGLGWSINNGGWHFSYMGDIGRKIRSWAHSEYNRPPFNEPEHIARCKQEGVDLFGRAFEYRFLDDLSYLPQCVQDDLPRFKHLIHGAA